MKDAVRGVLQGVLGRERYLYWFARWSTSRAPSATLEEFSQLVEPGSVVLDLGAGIGMTCVPLARSNPTGHVHAFEPHPLNRSVLRRVVGATRTRNVTVHEVAVGEESRVAQMVMPIRSGAALFGLTHVVHDSIEVFNEGEIASVRVVALDEYLHSGSAVGRVGGIKIDVENFEYFALRGCRNILQRDRPPILCELWNNDNRRKTREFLEGLDYECSVLEGGRRVPFEPGRHHALDFFFLPAGT
jgi:FkbM family methyltransferase